MCITRYYTKIAMYVLLCVIMEISMYRCVFSWSVIDSHWIITKPTTKIFCGCEWQKITFYLDSPCEAIR